MTPVFASPSPMADVHHRVAHVVLQVEQFIDIDEDAGQNACDGQGQKAPLLPLEAGKAELGAKALDEAGDDDGDAARVAVEQLHDRSQQFRDEAGALLADDVSAQRTGHEPDAVDDVKSEVAETGRGECGSQCHAEVEDRKVHRREYEAKKRHHDDVAQRPALLVVQIVFHVSSFLRKYEKTSGTCRRIYCLS